MSQNILPVGKLPVDLLGKLLAQAQVHDPRVVVGPGVGLDCAVVETGASLLVLKSDPITFVTDEIGWYVVQVNANDIATTGAVPRWLLITMLFPEGQTTPEQIEQITGQINDACQQIDVAVIGGHTEITHGLERPLVLGTMIGEVDRDKLVTPRGLNPGDRILLTKGVPIEATAILAREFPERLAPVLSADELHQARRFLTDPGISVLRDAQIARQAGTVTAMHDPTEGGLAAALWELAAASDHTLVVDTATIPIPAVAQKVCQVFDIDPLAAIASGALILTTPAHDVSRIQSALAAEGIACSEIGHVESGSPVVWNETETGRVPLARPDQDEIARIFGD